MNHRVNSVRGLSKRLLSFLVLNVILKRALDLL
jgi:hypothetical protein